ncbi:hypothetical protein E0L93_11665 [Rubrobacter taiwanensis]|uniref:Uncharacterized protein n=1 Tax=Rubrobacter taiwanensis TaxID=185139 RepID=A0A4R1BFE3_9ACTN|nr:hypothetical protein [Rubrobacter taiwanensis]TCJ15906.1 hypothetical protein E0L93_11665 [Rubrobacter taiwanensis]
MDHNSCEGVVDCTALVIAEGYAEVEGKITLFGILEELKVEPRSPASFVVYAKFEGCEHAGDRPWPASVLVSDEDGQVLQESEEYALWFDESESQTIIAEFDVPEDFAAEERVLWVEAVLEDSTVSQTAVWIRERYNV